MFAVGFDLILHLWPVITLCFGVFAMLQALEAARDDERSVAIGLLIISLLLIGLALHVEPGDRSLHRIFGESLVNFL